LQSFAQSSQLARLRGGIPGRLARFVHRKDGRTIGLEDGSSGTQILSTGVEAMTETLWRCDQVRFGQLYNRMMFDTKHEAEEFVQRMRPMEPDQQFSIEAIEASKIWN